MPRGASDDSQPPDEANNSESVDADAAAPVRATLAGEVLIGPRARSCASWSFVDPTQGPNTVYDGDWLSDVRKIGADNYYPRLHMEPGEPA